MIYFYQQLPGPKGLPFIGSLLQVKLSKLHTYFEQLAPVYGDVYKVKLGPTRLTVISNPELIQQILKSRPTHFRRVSKLDSVLRREGIHGVFNAEGDEWKVHRRIVTRGLDVKHLQKFFPAMVKIADRLYHKMNAAASLPQPYTLQEDLLRFTVDVTTSLAFGIDMNTLEQQNGAIQEHMEKIFPMIFRRINSPFAWYKYISTSKDRQFETALQSIEKQVTQFIREGRNRIEANPGLREHPENILDALLSAADDEKTISDREIKGNLLTLLMAGEDTTAHSLAWALYLLCKNPDVQQKLKEEATIVLGDDHYLKEYARHDELIYTNAVIHETLRLKAVAPVMLVEPLADVVMDKYQFKQGARIVLLTRSVGVREAYFSDSLTMKPERWLQKGICPVHSPEAMMPFGHGPRLCPGKNLALLEMKLVLSMMAKNFHIQLANPGQEIGENMAFTMMPDAYQVILHPNLSL